MATHLTWVQFNDSVSAQFHKVYALHAVSLIGTDHYLALRIRSEGISLLVVNADEFLDVWKCQTNAKGAYVFQFQ